MRSIVLSLALGLGMVGLSLATPAQTRADEIVGPANSGATIPVAHRWYGGRSFYPGYGYGNYRGYYPNYRYGAFGAYPYGGYGGYGIYNRGYYPRAYGRGYSPWGYGYGVRPYSNFYYSPGFFW